MDKTKDRIKKKRKDHDPLDDYTSLDSWLKKSIEKKEKENELD